MSFTGYEEYKNSGFDWLGEIPNHWKTIPLWTYFRRVKRTGFIDEELLSVYRDYGVILKASRDDNHNRASEDLEPYQLVNIGDLVINKMKAFQGSVAISDYRGIVSPAYFVFDGNHSSNPRFLHYLMRSNRYIFAYLSISKGIRPNQWDLEPQYHSRLPLVIPPAPEQKIIADFLDHETAKIDVLVTEQEKLIELLKEKRQAVISNAVTKGLDPKVKMKHSGVEWLGEIPENWDVRKASNFFTAKKGTQASQLTKEYCSTIEGEYPVYSGQTENNGVISEIDTYEFDSGEEGCLFATTVGAKAMTVSHIKGKFSLSQNCMIIISTQSNLSIRFYYYHLQALFLFERALIPDHIQPSFRMEDLYSYRIAVPPLNEQERIVEFLDTKSDNFSKLITEASNSIDLLKERRSALISAAVTGQIDVRNYQPKEVA